MCDAGCDQNTKYPSKHSKCSTNEMLPHQEELANILNGNISFVPLIYLGLPLGAFLSRKPYGTG
jgi:hypothetical protein